MKRDYSRLVEIVHGDRTDIFARTIRLFLFTLSLVYRLIIKVRNWAYDVNLFSTDRVDVPVISVGNLTAGGTGKTPFVIWLIEQLQGTHDIAVVSRGYGAANGLLNDEGREIEQRIDNLVQIQHPDRIAASRKAILQLRQNATSQRPLIILDDGFQHRRLGRDLDLVLIDATCPFGFDHLLPRGLLREPTTQLQRANVAVLTRANLVSPAVRSKIKDRVLNRHPHLDWVETALVHGGWLRHDQKIISPAQFEHTQLFAFCGIGNPDGFFRTLNHEKLDVRGCCRFTDHHLYQPDDLQDIFNRAREHACDAIVCTHKDLVKIDFDVPHDLPMYAFLTDVQISEDSAPIIQQIVRVVSELENPR